MKLTKLIESEYTSMNYFAEKIFFGTLTLTSSGVAALGAILSEGDARWFYVTFAVGPLVSTCMALMTRRNESMKVVAGVTPEQVYANIKSLTDKAKGFGMRTVVSTIPMPDSTWQALNSGTNGTRLTAYNNLVRTGHINGDFDHLCDAANFIPPYNTDPSKWFDTIHPNAAGNALWKDAFMAGVDPV